MTAVHTSFGLHDSASFASNNVEHANTAFKPSTQKGVAPISDTRSALSHPLPLPEFVFPARKLPSITTPSPYSRWTNPRTRSLICLGSNEKQFVLDDMFKNLLPYSENGHCDSEPVSPCTVSPRTEFQQKCSNELTKTENGSRIENPALESYYKTENTPTFRLPPIPLGRSRGHAHRRSAAISSGDLSIILKPNISLRVASSLPNSPKSDLHAQNISPNLAPEFSTDQEASNPLSIEARSPFKALKSTRVEFSDDVQIIPRPLSIFSCDAASTTRSGHSTSNSLSSTLSAATNLPIPKTDRPINSPMDQRPRTAEPFSERDEFMMGHAPKRSGSLPHIYEKKLAPTEFFTFPPVLDSTNCETGHEDCVPGNENCNSDSTASYSVLSKKNCQPRRSSFSGKSMNKQKKVKSWAGSILSRKARQRSQKKQKFSRPPPTSFVSSGMPVDATASSNSVSILSVNKFQLESEIDYVSWIPRNFPPLEEPMSPVIDLDAALGPFNTPTTNFEIQDNIRRGSKKKAMHSAAGLGGFSGPGMHYHRRAESAPEFENPRFGLHRLGSSSTMAMEDVFEEDEDELWDEVNDSDKQINSEAGGAEHESDYDLCSPTDAGPFESVESSQDHVFECQTFRSRVDIARETDSNFSQSTKSFIDLIKNRKSAASLEAFSETTNISDSAVQSLISTSPEKSRQEISPIKIPSVSLQMVFPNPTPTSSRSAATQSPFPSPLSPLSYDTQFISTAPSSTTDDHGFESLLLGEPGPELRMSVDDLPSLTSTDSTMTRESFNPNSVKPRLRDGQRSASFSTTIANRKRSSIASLSRLISSAHGERSKLAIESRAPSYCEGVSQHKSSSKTKRISRLMKFWRKSEDLS